MERPHTDEMAMGTHQACGNVNFILSANSCDPDNPGIRNRWVCEVRRCIRDGGCAVLCILASVLIDED